MSSEIDILYRRFAPAVYRRARRLLGDEQEALDVTQETFLAFMRAHGQLRGEASAFTVLFQIATHRGMDRLRRRARWSGVLARLSPPPDDEGAEVGSSDGTDPGAAMRVEAAMDLAMLTKGEDPQTLTAAVLYYVEGHTTEEVAQVLDLSRKTVGRLLASFVERGRKREARLKGRAA